MIRRKKQAFLTRIRGDHKGLKQGEEEGPGGGVGEESQTRFSAGWSQYPNSRECCSEEGSAFQDM